MLEIGDAVVFRRLYAGKRGCGPKRGLRKAVVEASPVRQAFAGGCEPIRIARHEFGRPLFEQLFLRTVPFGQTDQYQGEELVGEGDVVVDLVFIAVI